LCIIYGEMAHYSILAGDHCWHPSYILGSCTSTVTLCVWLGTAVLLGVASLVGDSLDLLEIADALLLARLPGREPWWKSWLVTTVYVNAQSLVMSSLCGYV